MAGLTWRFAASAVLMCAAIEGYALADRSRGEPRNLDIRRYVLGEIYDAYRVQQRFLVKANGFSSVTIHPRPMSAAPTGSVVVDLIDMTAGKPPTSVKRISTPTATFARLESFTMHFSPQSSLYHEYSLEITVVGGSDGQGIGLLATRGEGYRGGSLLINDGRPRFGDLVFETKVDDAVSNFGAIASQMGRGGIPASRMVLLLVLLGKYSALFLVIRVFARSGAAAGPTTQIRPPLQA